MPTGKQIFAQINTRGKLAPKLARQAFPMIDVLFNTDYSERKGDVLIFDALLKPNLKPDTDTDCSEIEFECIGSRQFELKLDRNWNYGARFSNCRVSTIWARLGNDYKNGRGTTAAVLEEFREDVMIEKMKIEVKAGIEKIYKHAETIEKDITIDGKNIVNIIQGVNEATNNVSLKNEDIADTAWIMLLKKSIGQKIGDLRTGCCDYINGLIPKNSTAPFNFLTVIMPESLMGDYDYIIYPKKFAFYGHQCRWSEFFQGENGLKTWTLFGMLGRWGFDFINMQPDDVKQLGQKGKFVSSGTPEEPVEDEETLSVEPIQQMEEETPKKKVGRPPKIKEMDSLDEAIE